MMKHTFKLPVDVDLISIIVADAATKTGFLSVENSAFDYVMA